MNISRAKMRWWFQENRERSSRRPQPLTITMLFPHMFCTKHLFSFKCEQNKCHASFKYNNRKEQIFDLDSINEAANPQKIIKKHPHVYCSSVGLSCSNPKTELINQFSWCCLLFIWCALRECVFVFWLFLASRLLYPCLCEWVSVWPSRVAFVIVSLDWDVIVAFPQTDVHTVTIICHSQ